MTDIGPFRLVNPPAGQEEIVRAAIEAIDYPWERLQLSEPIEIEWTEQGMGTASGFYHGYSNKITLSSFERHLNPGVGFVLAHEIGHLVDDEGLNDDDRARLIALMHSGPFIQMGHFNHDHPDAGHVDEYWSNGGDAYVSKIYECFADQFVAAFAPTIWDGTFIEGASRRWPRFVHWTENHQAVRELTLGQKPIPPQSTPTPESKEKVLSRYDLIDHALRDLNVWLKRHPKKTKTRFKVLAARRILRAIKPN